MDIKPNLDQMNVRLIAVGNGSANFARKFQNGLPFTGEVYLDPESNTYKALALYRLGKWEVMKRFFFSLTAMTFYKNQAQNYAHADTEGDGQQTGGVFVVGPGRGKQLLYQFRENDHTPEVFADNNAILEACAKHGASL